MGKSSIYITAASGAYLSASVSWTATSSSGSTTVYIDVSSNGGWRLKKDSTVYFEKQGSYSGSFTASIGSIYQFQLWDTVEQTWQLQNFTVTQDSGGGGSGGTYTITYYDGDGSWFATQTETGGEYFTAYNRSYPSKTGSSSSSNFVITGNANGGSFPSGATTSITATKTTTITYNFSSWNTNTSGTGTTYYAGSSYIMPNSNLNLYPYFTTSSSSTVSNNALSRLTSPNPPPGSTNTYTVTFNPQGGTVNISSQSVTATTTKSFGGWMTSSTGTSTVSSLDQAGTVYAKWINNYSNNTITLPTPTRSGYNFIGWSTSTNGTNLKGAGASISISGNTTFYAFWAEKEKSTGGIFIHDGNKWQLISG